MATGSQPDHDCYRTIVFRERGNALLVVPTECGFVLPSVEIPRWERVAENLTAAMRQQWGCDAICLFSPEVNHSSDGPTPPLWQVMECFHDSETSNSRTVWTPVSSLSAQSLADSADYTALRKSLDLLRMPPDDSQPFARLGWFQELQEWVQEVSRPLGVELTGKFCQLNASPSFSLIRFETTGAALWFKAVGKPNQHEFPITLKLAERFPTYLPRFIGSRADWRGWLMRDGGRPIADMAPTVEDWKDVVWDLASLQVESISQTGELRQTGVRDLRSSKLMDLIDPFVDAMHVVMQEQPTVSTSQSSPSPTCLSPASPSPASPAPAPLAFAELFAIGRALKETLGTLDELGIPATLGHNDFNPGNILRNNLGTVFIDWAEAYVGPPFFTLEYLVSRLRRDWPEAATFEPLVRSAYAQVWKHVIPISTMEQAFGLSPVAAVFAYAISCWQVTTTQDPHSRACLRSLTRRMKREADRLNTRRMACLQF